MTGGGWRDMSTAPRDGTVVTVSDPHAYIRSMRECAAFWREDRQCWQAQANGFPLARPDGWRPLGGGS